METRIDLTPEFKELQGQFTMLRDELAKLICERETMLTVDKRALEAEYYTLVGHKQVEMLAMRNEALRLKRKFELINALVNRGERYDLQQIENALDAELLRWETELRELLRKVKTAEYVNQLPLLSTDEIIELRHLFRQLVRRLHPDLNADLTERDKLLWHRVIAAYEHGDLAGLKVIVMLLEEPAGESDRADLQDELTQKIAFLKTRITHLIDEMGRIAEQFPFGLRAKLRREDWVAEQNAETDKIIAGHREQRDKYAVLLTALMSGQPPGSILH